MAIRKFQRQFGGGSTVYKCRVCKRQTRNTGDEGSTGNCRQCYDLAGIDNHLNDNHGNDYTSPEGVAAFRRYEGEIEGDIAEILAKGGNADMWTKAGESFVADWRIAMATPPPAPVVEVTPVTTTAPSVADALVVDALRVAARQWREIAGYAPSLADKFKGQATAADALALAIEVGTIALVTNGGRA